MKKILALAICFLLHLNCHAQSGELSEALVFYKSAIEIKVFYQKSHWDTLVAGLQKELNQENSRDEFIPFPDSLKIDLIIMDADTYFEKTKAPDWVNPFYYEGKIYLKISGQNYNIVALAASLRHEIIHAIVNHWAGKNTPFWFDEGLAKWHEGEMESFDLLNFKKHYKNSGYTSLQDLDKSFATMPKNVALAAYTQGAICIEYLLDTFGSSTIKNILKKSTRNTDFEKVLLQATGLNYQALDARLKKYVRDRFAIN